MILVTGASGLVGQHLLESLSQRYSSIRAICRKLPARLFTDIVPGKVQWIECDILDLPDLDDAFEGVTHVYHCAAMVSYDSRYKDAMMECNVAGTANVVNLCLDHKIQKLCHVSSIATLGDGSSDMITENNDWEPGKSNSNYSMSKQDAEMEIRRGIAEGLNAVIVNPGIILGEGDESRSSTNLFQVVADNFPYYTSGATAWVDVKDVVKMMISLMESNITGERFIASEGNYFYKDVFTMMANAMGKKPPHRYAGKFLTSIVWRMAYIKSLMSGKVASITRETARSAHAIRKFDNRKYLELDHTFSYTPLIQTIERISRYRAAHT